MTIYRQNMTLSELADAATTELLGFADVVDGLSPDQRTSETPCAGWTIDDLATHVATGAFRDAEALHRARIGSTSVPGVLDLGDADAGATIRAAAEHLLAALQTPPARWPAVPTPFGTYPAADALRCMVIEFGVHLDDLHVATGHPAGLSPATLAVLFGVGEAYLLRQASPLAGGPVTFTLSAPSITMSVSWTGAGWRAGAGGEVCRIIASDDDVAHLMLRRLDVGSPRVDVADGPHLASLFADAFRPL